MNNRVALLEVPDAVGTPASLAFIRIVQEFNRPRGLIDVDSGIIYLAALGPASVPTRMMLFTPLTPSTLTMSLDS